MRDKSLFNLKLRLTFVNVKLRLTFSVTRNLKWFLVALAVLLPGEAPAPALKSLSGKITNC